MMFPWSIARSVDTVLSRWLVKRLCKFVLKKKLGQFLVDDIRADQLDIQLGYGVVHLRDLILDVNYLNQKFGEGAFLIIKEGSIGCLSVKLPSRGKSFQIEIDELELVITFAKCSVMVGDGDINSIQEHDDHVIHSEKKKLGDETYSTEKPGSSVHEGVKAIAKMMKWLLASFNVKVKTLIVGFEWYPDEGVRDMRCQKDLVFRVSEVDCGTCISEDSCRSSDSGDVGFLQTCQLTSFVKFHGAFFEFLDLENDDDERCDEVFSGLHQPSASYPIVQGNKGGFSGNLSLNIPCKDGAFDISQVALDVAIGHVELRVQPSTVKWLSLLWKTVSLFKNGRRTQHQHTNEASTEESVASNDVIHACFPSASAISSWSGNGCSGDTVLPCSQVIADWVPIVFEGNNNGITNEESDLAGSVDQFFECFDSFEHSQSSIFGALSIASAIASGSCHVPSGPQIIDTNLKVTCSGISALLSLQDGDDQKFHDLKGELHDCSSSSTFHYMGAECRDIFFVLQVSPQEISSEGSVEHIEITWCSSRKNVFLNPHTEQSTTINNNAHGMLILHIQSEVQNALPPSALASRHQNSGELSMCDASFHASHHGLVETQLLSSSGFARFHFKSSPNPKDGILGVDSLLSLHLPPFILWVDPGSINLLLDLLFEVRESLENSFASSYSSSSNDHEKQIMGTFKCNVSILNSRVILCFASDPPAAAEAPFSPDQFIAIDFSSSSKSEGIQDRESMPPSSPRYDSSDLLASSLSFSAGDVKVYMVASTARHKLFARTILSACTRGGFVSTVALFWQRNCTSGPWVAEKAKFLASSSSSEFSGSGNGSVCKGSEFASVAAAAADDDDDNGGLSYEAQEEMILSSSFYLHARLCHVSMNLGDSEFDSLQIMLDQVARIFSRFSLKSDGLVAESDWAQTSVSLQCDSLEIFIQPSINFTKNLLHNELTGLWDSFRLKICKLDLFHVLNTGGILGSHFFCSSHSEANLWGSVSEVPDRNFLLVSCADSAMKRGDGTGSNPLSTRKAGSATFCLFDPNDRAAYVSVLVRCCTLVAPGGRLDWLGALSSFSSFSSMETNGAQQATPGLPPGGSFCLKLVDAGLSYEPYLGNVGGCYSYGEDTGRPYTACLLASSSFTLSHHHLHTFGGWKIRVQDLGFLICEAKEKLGCGYGVKYLRDSGYVKVAWEALVEVTLRTNCGNKLLWEAECSSCHVHMETCHDTTSGLFLLIAQLQQLVCPVSEELGLQMQARWSSIKEDMEGNLPCGRGTVLSQASTWTPETTCECGTGGPIAEPYDFVFHTEENGFSTPIVSPDGSVARETTGWYGGAPCTIMEDHVSGNKSGHCKDLLLEEDAGSDQCGKAAGRVMLKDCNFTWTLYSGSDWLGDSKNPEARKSVGRRNSASCLELVLSGVQVRYSLFPDNEAHASEFSLSLQELFVYDRSKNAPWKQVVGFDHPKDLAGKFSVVETFQLSLEAIRPDSLSPLEEFRLRVALLPVLLHLHQSQLDFLILFFSDMSLPNMSPIHQSFADSKILSWNGVSSLESVIQEEALLPYFQKFDVLPVLIRIYYSPSHVNLAALRGGRYLELVNLVPLKGVQLQLKHVQAAGVFGWGSVCETILEEWMHDISQNQIHKILQGLSPIRSMVSVGSGIAKLVALPVRCYRNDQRVLHGFQRGAIAFLKSVSLEAVGLGVHLAAEAHDILLQTEHVLRNKHTSYPPRGNAKSNMGCNQPSNAKQGIQQAYESLCNGLGKSASAIVQTPLKEYKRGASAKSAWASAFKAVPSAAITPVSACASAAHYALLGVRNSLDPVGKKESMQKYLGPTQPLH